MMVVLVSGAACDEDSDSYRRTIAAVIRTILLLMALVTFFAGSWLA